MHEANLTRFGPQRIKREQDKPTTFSTTFNAMDGPAKLVLNNEGINNASIQVNGNSVVQEKDLATNGEITASLSLKKKNSIEVSIPQGAAGALGIRVTQVTKADLGVLRQGYFGLNTTDIERQRALYDTMGFIGEIYPAGPETSTTFAQALGFPDDYLIHVSLHSLENPPTPPFVDTVQFRGDSHREEPPYANLNHIGMTYATYSTTDLDGDYAFLQSKGVDFLSAPATAPNGERFVFLKDQDGIFLKLIQVDNGDKPTPGCNLVRLANTNMNVTDLERSREFYRLIGFSESAPGAQAGSGEFAAAHGFDEPIEFDGEDITLIGENDERATLQLRRWHSPYDDAPAYAPPVNHLGIDRINFYVKDLTATVKTLTELGFERLGPIGGSKEIGIVFFFDPDGIKVQFAGPQTD